MKVALVAYARHENRYLKEWIDYYAGIGVDHIFIGDNNDVENDEDILSFVDSLGYSDFVTVFDRKNRPDETDFNMSRQPEFYTEIYHQYGCDYDWMAFFDIDEFFTAFTNFCPNNIKDYIEKCIDVAVNECKYTNEDAITDIRISWLMYSDNNNIFYEDKPVLERFTEITDKIYHTSYNWLLSFHKSIVKTKKDFIDINIHYPYSKDPNYSTVTLINGGSVVCRNKTDVCGFHSKHDAAIKHFFSKSLEEFLERRIFDKKSHNIKDQSSTFDSIVENYFRLNERTLEKEKVIELYRKIYENDIL